MDLKELNKINEKIEILQAERETLVNAKDYLARLRKTENVSISVRESRHPRTMSDINPTAGKLFDSVIKEFLSDIFRVAEMRIDAEVRKKKAQMVLLQSQIDSYLSDGQNELKTSNQKD